MMVLYRKTSTRFPRLSKPFDANFIYANKTTTDNRLESTNGGVADICHFSFAMSVNVCI